MASQDIHHQEVRTMEEEGVAEQVVVYVLVY